MDRENNLSPVQHLECITIRVAPGTDSIRLEETSSSNIVVSV